jgi:hypothetical protein
MRVLPGNVLFDALHSGAQPLMLAAAELPLPAASPDTDWKTARPAIWSHEDIGPTAPEKLLCATCHDLRKKVPAASTNPTQIERRRIVPGSLIDSLRQVLFPW